MCLIVPPSIHRNLLKNGNSDQRNVATDMLRSIKHLGLARLEHLRDTLLNPKEELPLFGKKVNKERFVYDAENKTTLPGKLVRKEDEASTGDQTADKAYEYAGATWDFYHKFFGRNSIDDKGMQLLLTVHYGKNYPNAFWNSKAMIFGDGDLIVFQNFVITDVVAHELTHGCVEHTANLVYSKQPGALNESFADIFGSMVKQFTLNQTVDQADWLIGAGIFTPQINGVALRNMAAPGTAFNDDLIGKDRQTDHMSRYDNTTSDNHGVHLNSGIPNKAFYTTAMMLGGHSWECAGKIWYKTLAEELKPLSQFQDCANATIKVASKLYGKTSKEVKAVCEGWKAVGITV